MYTCPKCGNENSDQDKFCRTCGVQLKKACPRCGTLLTLNQNYCFQCGNKLDPTSYINFNKGIDPNRVEPVHQDNTQGYYKTATPIIAFIIVVALGFILAMIMQTYPLQSSRSNQQNNQQQQETQEDSEYVNRDFSNLLKRV